MKDILADMPHRFRISNYMLWYQRVHGCPPTLRAISAATAVSLGDISSHLRSLVKSGHVRHLNPCGSRRICYIAIRPCVEVIRSYV